MDVIEALAGGGIHVWMYGGDVWGFGFIFAATVSYLGTAFGRLQIKCSLDPALHSRVGGCLRLTIYWLPACRMLHSGHGKGDAAG